MKKYQPKEFEKKWQDKWEAEGIYKTDLNRTNKYYVLAEFAYPSGDLHVGHWFTWCGADMYARIKRMQGYNVFFPNGFDSFGLPAEGAAIKRNVHPLDWTNANIKRMKEQYATLGASFDFYGDLASHKSSYYKWNQWIFLKMFERGLAYRGKYLANWCPNDQTVLANEAVESGKCWRCGAEVIQKQVDQWFFKITDYADRLIWPEKPAVDWPKSVREAQNDWIGRKEGIDIAYDIIETKEKVIVFTTRPDTNFGATFLAIAPEHPLIEKIVTPEQKEEVQKYLKYAQKKSELERKENKEKTGVFTGVYALNPLTNYKMPIWISDFVLMGFGTGALVGVPGHDKRDFEFAKKFGLEIIRVVRGINGDTAPIEDIDQVQEDVGEMMNSDFLDGLDIHEATIKMMDYLEQKGWGERKIQYHIHDWSISRQRYWGTPIPIIHCPKCGMVPVAEDQLPVELPYDVDFMPMGKSPLASNEQWLNIKCPQCGGEAERDADTMDTFVDSSWYFFRYLNPSLEIEPFDTDLSSKIMPVDIYFGGAEHTLGHTLYSRFLTKVFHDLNLTTVEEYALRRVNHGIVLGPDGQKMSKSKDNVVNPDDEVQKFGSDSVRLHVGFFMPYDGVGPWISERIWGPYHFLERVWGLFDKVSDLVELTKKDKVKLNQTIKKVEDDSEQIKFNTAIAALMEWLNYLSVKKEVSRVEYKTFNQLLAPFAPHIAEEIWELLGETGSIHLSKWPEFDPNLLEDDQVTIVVQVNGKLRDSMTLERLKIGDQDEIEQAALANPKVNKFLEEKTPKKVIYVPGKVLNFVI